MFILLLTAEFQLPGCQSLKDKRQRLSGLRQKFGKINNIAVCEIDRQDSQTFSVWAFTLTGNDKPLLEKQAAQIEQHLRLAIDAVLLALHREWL